MTTTVVEQWFNDYKQCGRCKQEKPIWDFEKNKSFRDGYRNFCIDCEKEYLENKKERYNEYIRERKRIRQFKRENNPKKHRYRKSEAKQRGLGWFLLFENFLPPEININRHHCNYFVVVPIPEHFHRKYSGSHNKHQKHIDKCNQWIKDYYYIDIENLLAP